MTLYLVRHGQASSGVEHLDPGLDAIGRSQAEHAAIALCKKRVERLVCSPLRRARQTAEPIATRLGLEPELRDEVSEIFAPGMNASDRSKLLLPLLSGRWSDQPESLRSWRKRVLSTLIELGDKDTVVVSHFVAISAAIGASTEDDRVSPCALANASITMMEVVSGKLTLRRAGEVAHLDRGEITSTHAALPGRP